MDSMALLSAHRAGQKRSTVVFNFNCVARVSVHDIHPIAPAQHWHFACKEWGKCVAHFAGDAVYCLYLHRLAHL